MPETPFETRAITLLLVEDDDVDAMGVERALEKRRIANTLVRARDGIEALEFLRGGKVARPFLILLDLNMPRMGGLEFIRTVRADPELCDSVVFVLTTSKSDEDLAAAYRAHVAGYMVKSRDRQLLQRSRRTARRLLAGRRTARAADGRATP